MYDAINRGQAKAGGEIFAWLNCDEQYLEGTLETVRKLFSKNGETDVLLGDAVLFGERGEPICYRRIIVPSRRHTRLFHLHSLSCATFFRKSALPVPLFDPRWRVIGDAALIDGLLGVGKKFATLGTPLAAYFFTGSNLSAKPNGEHETWWREERRPPGFMRPFVRVWHFFRRAFAGSYRVFDVSIKIYFETSKTCRVIWEKFRAYGRKPAKDRVRLAL